MQLRKSSGEDSWWVPSAQLDEIIIAVGQPTPANDTGIAAPWTARGEPSAPQSRTIIDCEGLEAEQSGLRRAMKKAVSWLMAETLCGFALCGTAAHPTVLKPDWSPYDNHPSA